MRARAVLDAIDDALVIASRAPVLFARMSRAGCSVVDLSLAYDMHVKRPPFAVGRVPRCARDCPAHV